MSRQATQNSHWSPLGKVSLALALMISTASLMMAQDAIRPSLAGEAAAEARRQSIDNIPYNLQLGMMKLRFSATLGVEYNDNVDLSDSVSVTVMGPNGPVTLSVEPQSDFIIRPQINLNALWPITQLNTLRLDLGLGYSFYLDHSNYDTSTVLISPGSQLAFDIFVGDFRFNFHDRFSIQNDPVQEIGLSNVADYTRFENTAGVSALWDLNSVVATLGYNYFNWVSFDDQFDYLDRHAQIVTASVAFTPNSTMSVGPEAAFVASDYNEEVLNDSIAFSAGLFFETQVTNYLKLRVAGGYQNINFDNIGTVNDSNDVSDYYANLLLSHRVNAVLTHSLSLGHENQLGVNSNFTTVSYIRHTANWNVFLHTLLTTELFYEDAIDSGGQGRGFLFDPYAAEHIHRYGGALSVGYQLTQHVTLGLRYQYIQKDSDLLLRDYRQNRVSLDGTYSF